MIETVASEPQPGDTVTMTTGLVRYTVLAVMLAATRGRSVVQAERAETFRAEPYTRTEVVEMSLAAWGDLVRYGACTVTRPQGRDPSP